MSEDEIETAAQPDEVVEVVEELVEDPIEVLETRVAELLSDLQYARAETMNARHRGQRDKAEAIRFGSAGLAVRILPAIDGLEKALANGDGDLRFVAGQSAYVMPTDPMVEELIETCRPPIESNLEGANTENEEEAEAPSDSGT